MHASLWVENPVNGNFLPVEEQKQIGGSTSNKLTEQKQRKSDEDNNLENSPLIPKLTDEDVGDESEKMLLVPPVAPILRDINQVYQPDEWTQVTITYRNFAFVKRCAFLIFQVTDLITIVTHCL